MNADTQPETQTPPDGIWQQTESPTESVSLSEHEATYSKEGREAGLPAGDEEPAPEGETAEQKAERLHHSAEQKREKETGKFAEGKKRHRAASQQASAEDVPRIRELTAKLRTAEAEVARLKAAHASPARIAQAEAKVDAVAEKAVASGWNEPAPKEDDPKFGGDYGKYLEARAEWAGRKAYHDERASERQQAQKAEQEQAQRKTLETWAQRVEASRGKYDDFDAVAFQPTRIEEGSPVDAFIMEDEHGADVLYHLNKHPEELSEILGMPAIRQLKALSLLSQRLSTESTPVAAGTTGAAPERKLIVLPPKPPTPVRTEAQRASDGPADPDAMSLSEFEKTYGRARRR